MLTDNFSIDLQNLATTYVPKLLAHPTSCTKNQSVYVWPSCTSGLFFPFCSFGGFVPYTYTSFKLNSKTTVTSARVDAPWSPSSGTASLGLGQRQLYAYPDGTNQPTLLKSACPSGKTLYGAFTPPVALGSSVPGEVSLCEP